MIKLIIFAFIMSAWSFIGTLAYYWHLKYIVKTKKQREFCVIMCGPIVWFCYCFSCVLDSMSDE